MVFTNNNNFKNKYFRFTGIRLSFENTKSEIEIERDDERFEKFTRLPHRYRITIVR